MGEWQIVTGFFKQKFRGRKLWLVIFLNIRIKEETSHDFKRVAKVASAMLLNNEK